MIRVFISYSEKDNGKDAEALCTCLKNAKEMIIDPILASRETSHAEENAEKIARNIDSSHFFIVFYTSKGKNNYWVNQELGYAFNHVRQYGLKIIPIYEKKEDFQGILTARSHNLATEFQLGEDRMKCFEKVKKYLIETYKHPIELEFQIAEDFTAKTESYPIKCLLRIANISPKILSQGTLDIIVPQGITVEMTPEEVSLAKTRLAPTVINKQIGSGFKDQIIQYKSDVIPGPLSAKFELTKNASGEDCKVHRTTVHLNDIYGINTYETTWRFTIAGISITEFDFGIYLTLPLFGPTFYNGTIFIETKKSTWENQDANAAKIRIRLC